MSRRRRDHRTSPLNAEFAPAAGVADPSTPQPRKPATVTLRLTAEERDRLEELAAGMTLSAYVRACVFQGEESRRRKRRARRPVQDRRAIAQVLGLLGQTRIANNLNQLAYQANIGALAMDDDAQSELEEVYGLVRTIRGDLITALNLCDRS